MKRPTVVILIFILAFIASNLWWIYHTMDTAVTASYLEVSYQDNHEALAQKLAILPVPAQSDSTRKQVLDAAKKAANAQDTYEKDGFIWVGRLGLKFDNNERLIEVSPAWDPF